MVAIFPKLCFWQRSLCSNLAGIDAEKLYRATLISMKLQKTIKDKLRIRKWRDLTIIGRIQPVKTFIIPTFLYRASGLICMDKEFVNEVNKIIFDFIWKGKDKVKRRVLVGDIQHGGLKAPHLDSIDKIQRILCCKKLASDDLSSWKIISSGVCQFWKKR